MRSMKFNIDLNKKVFFFLGALIIAQTLSAHTINYALEKAPVNDVIWFYSSLGIRHIIPEGLDHIFFIIGICLLGTNIKTILWQATAFTLAHSITLALSMKNIIVAPGQVVEPIISLSIMFVAIENMITDKLKAWRILIIFTFGLIHGMGFASALNEIGLPPGKFLLSVLSFNLGVEIGQVLVILAVFALIIKPFRNMLWYRKFILAPISCCIAIAALYWTVLRV
jgi:hypothetical protein